MIFIAILNFLCIRNIFSIDSSYNAIRYGYKCEGKAPDYDDLDAGAKRVVEVIKAWNGTVYRSGDICNTIYGYSF